MNKNKEKNKRDDSIWRRVTISSGGPSIDLGTIIDALKSPFSLTKQSGLYGPKGRLLMKCLDFLLKYQYTDKDEYGRDLSGFWGKNRPHAIEHFFSHPGEPFEDRPQYYISNLAACSLILFEQEMTKVERLIDQIGQNRNDRVKLKDMLQNDGVFRSYASIVGIQIDPNAVTQDSQFSEFMKKVNKVGSYLSKILPLVKKALYRYTERLSKELGKFPTEHELLKEMEKKFYGKRAKAGYASHFIIRQTFGTVFEISVRYTILAYLGALYFLKGGLIDKNSETDVYKNLESALKRFVDDYLAKLDLSNAEYPLWRINKKLLSYPCERKPFHVGVVNIINRDGSFPALALYDSRSDLLTTLHVAKFFFYLLRKDNKQEVLLDKLLGFTQTFPPNKKNEIKKNITTAFTKARQWLQYEFIHKNDWSYGPNFPPILSGLIASQGLPMMAEGGLLGNDLGKKFEKMVQEKLSTVRESPYDECENYLIQIEHAYAYLTIKNCQSFYQNSKTKDTWENVINGLVNEEKSLRDFQTYSCKKQRDNQPTLWIDVHRVAYLLMLILNRSEIDVLNSL